MRTTRRVRVFGVGKNILHGLLFSMICGAAILSFFLFVADSKADQDVIRPDGDTGTANGTPIGCGGGGDYDCLDEVITEPTAPSTGSDYLTMVNNDFNRMTMQTVSDVATATAVTVWYYHVEGGTNAQQTIELVASDGFTNIAGPTGVTTRTAAQWDFVTFSGLSLTQTDLDGLQVELACTKVGGGGSNTCTGYALYADVTYDPQVEVNVATLGSQRNLDVGTTSAHIGGSLVIEELVGSRNVTSIKITENGTVDAANDLDNIELWYDLDTTGADSYNCSSESFNGDETQFGSTDIDGFSGANGVSTFTDNVGISTTASMCVYVVLDVLESASAAENLQIEISDPSVDVTADGGADVQPNTTVALSGNTTLIDSELRQIHYHWRNDDGDETETGATSVTGGEDTPYGTLSKETPARLRIEVTNQGNATSEAHQYRLEYAKKLTSCSAASGWTNVDATGGEWEMFDSADLTEGADTTNIAVSAGGVTDENATFLTPNGGVRDTSSQTGSLTLTSNEFVELEYSIRSTASSTEGTAYCFRLTDAGSPMTDFYTIYPEATILADAIVSTKGTQRPTVDIPTADVDAGANFVIIDNIAGDTTVQSVSITASGTVDLQNDIYDIELWYDLDTTGGDSYNCSDESFDGDEAQYGTTDADGFSVTAMSTFSEDVIINTTQSLCLYVIYSASSTITNDETLSIQIDNPSVDVVLDSGNASPAALVELSGATQFVTDDATQIHYHWRNDDGDETAGGATSATDGNEDTTLEKLRQSVPKRLRIEVSNEGSSSTPAHQYRLEYAPKQTSCSAATGWTDVGAAEGAFDMFDSPNVTDGTDTTNITLSAGGVTDEEATFLTNNNAVKDTSSQTGGITLAGDEFVELEYSIVATASSTEGAFYCFRVSDAGTAIKSYSVYPEVEIRPTTDFFVQRDIATISGTSLTLQAGTDYVAPSSSSTAFIRITNTLNTGAGGGATGNADDVTVYITNQSNIENSVTLTRPAGATGNTRVAWELIEYTGAPGGDNEIIVRQQSTATYGTGATTVTTNTVPNVVDDTDITVFITGQLNPDTTTGYPLGNSTAAWNSGADTATFTRGTSGNAAGVSYAVVEFVGNNWSVQRSEHTYSALGTTETESISPVNSLTRTFLHSQKRMGSGLNTHGDFGHQVWLSGVGQVSYVIDSTGSTPGSHTSVAWIIENTQSIGDSMVVTRSNGTQSGGASPTALNVNIGKTVDDTQSASIFMNNLGDEPGGGGGQNSFPEPMMSARLISETQYELWIPDTSDSRSWRTEVVEWPTAARDIIQNYYRFYVHNDVLDPTDPWPVGATDLGENTEVTGLDDPIASGEAMRIRMTLAISSAEMTPGLDTFTLQYGKRDITCTAIGEGSWRDVGGIGSTTAIWRGTTTSVTDGTALSTDPPAAGDLNISVADVAGTYEEENISAVTPYEVVPGEDVEYDWVVENNGAPEKTEYCFRMIESSGTLFDGYNFYPTMRTAGFGVESETWQWYDDAENETPSVALAATNTAPVDIAFNDTVQLRIVLDEINGSDEKQTKFRLQFSETSDFASTTNVEEVGNCVDGESLWCYGNGGGVDNATITATLIPDADSCSSGVGSGCGSHNESGTSSTTSTHIHPAAASSEYAFTLRHAGALVNRVYYFRVYDEANGEVVPLAGGQSYPSLVTEGAALAFTMSNVSSSTATEGVTTDVETTATQIDFGTVPINTEYEAAHRLAVDANGTEGYKVLMYSTGDLTDSIGQTIEPVSGSNAAPTSWSIGCPAEQKSCFGYHSGDDLLDADSTRFSADDTYAAVSSTTPEEVLFSSSPVAGETTDIIYKMEIREIQGPGEYETSIIYIATPIF